MTSCRTVQTPQQTVHEIKTITEFVRDTTFVVEPDSAQLRALIECSENNVLLLKSIEQSQGESITINIVATRENENSMLLSVDCKTDSLKHEIELRDKLIETITAHTEYVYLPYKPPWWARTLQWVGGIFLVIIVVATICYCVKLG